MIRSAPLPIRRRATGLALLILAATQPALADCYDRDATGRQTRFDLRGGEAQDKRTGLVWQRCSLGLSWDGRACRGEIAYAGLEQAIAAAPPGWRVPSGPELESLVDVSCDSPVADTTVFPDIRADDEGHAKYWTTNPLGTLDLYWNFDFIDGHPDGNSRGVQLAVRFVRGGR